MSSSGRSLVQRSPTECGVPDYDPEAWIMSRHWTKRGCCAIKIRMWRVHKNRFGANELVLVVT